MYSSYPHGEKGYGMICSAAAGYYCSACGAGATIGWLLRHRAEVPGAAGIARKTFNTWCSEHWYNWQNEAPFIQAIVEELERLEKAEKNQ